MWKVPVLMAAMLAAGVCTGYNERAMIANECRQSSAFTHKRTGFVCEVRRAAK